MASEIMKQKIKDAWIETARKEKAVKQGRLRQRYHFMPQAGWMNDPNGLIYFRGKYHIFYQYNPYEAHWGNIHWGHAVSGDMLHWEYLPPALAPSETYDTGSEGGCFSGSAIEHEGKLFLMYTGAAETDKGIEQTQCIAYSEDGIHFEKYKGNPVLTAPEWVASDCFRDPKLWKHSGRYYMVCGAGSKGRGQALLYYSDDLLHWEFLNVMAESCGEWGYMWECPDFYKLEDKYVLTFSPIGAGLHTAVYMTGDFDYHTGKFLPLVCREMDWGFDYYAPQSFRAPDGRRIVISWANEWEWMPFYKGRGPVESEGWCGFFNIPREVHLTQDNTLLFSPVNELKQLRHGKQEYPLFWLGETQKEIKAGDGNSFEIEMEVDLGRTDAERIELDLRCGGRYRTRCVFDLKKGEMSVDREKSDPWNGGICKSTLFLKGKEKLDIQIYSDRSSLEIFANQYQNNYSVNIFPEEDQKRILIHAHGGNACVVHCRTYGMA